MKRLITETPKNNLETMHNLVYIKDKEVYLLSITSTGEDMNLYDYIRQKDELYAQDDNETIAELMCDEIDTPLQLAYWLAVGFAEVREQLKRYEDSGLTPAEVTEMQSKIKRLKSLLNKAIADLAVECCTCVYQDMETELCKNCNIRVKGQGNECLWEWRGV